MAGTRYALSKVNPVLLDWDHDDLYTTDPSRFVSWQGTRYDALPAFQAGTGQELHGLSAPPALLNPAAGDFRPGPGSPLVDRGVPIPGINDGFAGAAPDVGAVESGSGGGGGGPVRLLTATGPGGGPHVRGFDAAGSPTSPSFFAYDPGFTGGLFLAVGDLDGGGQPHIVTGVGLGGGAHVRAFDLDGAPRATSFLVYPPGFTGGVRVAACDFDGDGRADIVTGAGPGGAPHVRVIALDAAGSPSRDLASFFAYDPAFTGGVFVGCGDVDGDDAPDLLVAPDAGGAPHVRVFGRQAGAPGGVGVLQELLAYAPGFTGGIRVAAGNLDGSDRASIVLGAGPGGGPHVRALKLAGTALVELASFFVYDPGFRNGVFVATGHVTGGGAADIVTSADAGGGPHVRVFSGTGADTGISVFAYDPAFTGGVRVGAVP
jgi:hypothetical protein